MDFSIKANNAEKTAKSKPIPGIIRLKPVACIFV